MGMGMGIAKVGGMGIGMGLAKVGGMGGMGKGTRKKGPAEPKKPAATPRLAPLVFAPVDLAGVLELALPRARSVPRMRVGERVGLGKGAGVGAWDGAGGEKGGEVGRRRALITQGERESACLCARRWRRRRGFPSRS